MKLRIEKAIYGGAGLAHIPLHASEGGGKTVFVPGTLPDELVEARLTDDRRSFANAELVSVIERSPLRITPDCEYVPRCGGCQYQHASYESQLQMKLDILKETLSRARLPVPEAIGALSSPAWGYRNRVRLHLVKQPQGLALAYRELASHSLLPVSHCPIAAPLLEQAITAVTRVGAATGVDKVCQEVEFFANSDQTQLLVSLWPADVDARKGLRKSPSPARQREQVLETFAERLKLELPALTGVGLFSENELMHWGERSLTYTVADYSYQVSLGSFFQVNRFLVADLLRLVIDDGRRSGRLAWDLYAGVGFFARALRFESVVAVESAGYSADDLKHNLARTQRMTRSNTLDFLRNQTRTPLRIKPDLIVADPPRAGMGKEVCTLLGKIGAPTLICISCDPATLARDLQSLLPFGYSIEAIHLVDLFPQTFHLETVAILKRN